MSPDEEVFLDLGYAYLELGFWPTFPKDSINIIPELSWDMDLKADLSLARMPPQEVLNLPWILGNPFKPDNPSTYGYRYKGDTPQDARKKGQIYSNLYSEINRLYKQELSDAKVSIMKKYKVKRGHALTDDQQIEANNLAREQLVDYLKDKYKGGLTSIPAQTRISASYGLLQILYETAVNEEDYPHGLSNRPENLNELSGLVYSLKYLVRMFSHNNIEFLSNSNWSTKFAGDAYLEKPISGYEGALQVIVHFWNSGKKTYYNDVFNNMENFLPRR